MKERSKNMKNQTVDLLPDADENLAKLEVLNFCKLFRAGLLIWRYYASHPMEFCSTIVHY